MFIYTFIFKGEIALSTLSRPDNRLLSALPYLTRGGSCIDVGTDHAYLPIYLVSEGIVSRAMACDINKGPLESAKERLVIATRHYAKRQLTWFGAKDYVHRIHMEHDGEMRTLAEVADEVAGLWREHLQK